METVEIKLSDEYIKLGQALKAAGMLNRAWMQSIGSRTARYR